MLSNRIICRKIISETGISICITASGRDFGNTDPFSPAFMKNEIECEMATLYVFRPLLNLLLYYVTGD